MLTVKDKEGYCANRLCGAPISDTNRTHIGGRDWCSQKCWSLMMNEKTNAEALEEFYKEHPEEKKEV